MSQLTLTMLSQSLLRSLESQLGESLLLSLFLFQLCLRRRPGAPGQFPGRQEGHCGLQLTKSSLFVRPAPSSLALTSRGVGTNDEGSRRRARRGPSVFLKEWPLAGKTGKIKGSRRTRLSPGALRAAMSERVGGSEGGKAARSDWMPGGLPSFTGLESPLTC